MAQREKKTTKKIPLQYCSPSERKICKPKACECDKWLLKPGATLKDLICFLEQQKGKYEEGVKKMNQIILNTPEHETKPWSPKYKQFTDNFNLLANYESNLAKIDRNLIKANEYSKNPPQRFLFPSTDKFTLWEDTKIKDLADCKMNSKNGGGSETEDIDKIYIGPKGGRYKIVEGKKKYLSFLSPRRRR